MKGVKLKILAIVAGVAMAVNAWAFTIEDDFESGTLNPMWNIAFNGGAPAQVDFVNEVKITKVISVPTLDGGKALRVRGENVVTVSVGTSWICGDACTLSFATLFNLKDSDPFIDFGEVIVMSGAEASVVFYDDVLNDADLPTWHSFVMNLAPGPSSIIVRHTNGRDTSTTSEMYLDKLVVKGAVSAVPVPGAAWFGLSGLAVLALKQRRKV